MEEIRDLKATSHERSHRTTIYDSNSLRKKDVSSNSNTLIKKKSINEKEKSLDDHFKFKQKMLQLRYKINLSSNSNLRGHLQCIYVKTGPGEGGARGLQVPGAVPRLHDAPQPHRAGLQRHLLEDDDRLQARAGQG